MVKFSFAAASLLLIGLVATGCHKTFMNEPDHFQGTPRLEKEDVPPTDVKKSKTDNPAELVPEKIEKIQCTFHSNSDYQIEINFDRADQKITGVSIYNVDWSQTAEGTFKKTASQTTQADKSFVVVLETKQSLVIPASVFEEGHKGDVIIDGQDAYSCE